MQNTVENCLLSPSKEKKKCLWIQPYFIKRHFPSLAPPPCLPTSKRPLLKAVFTQAGILRNFSPVDGPCQNGAKALGFDICWARETKRFVMLMPFPFFFPSPEPLIKIDGLPEMLWLRRWQRKAIDGHGMLITHLKTCHPLQKFFMGLRANTGAFSFFVLTG